LIQDLIQSNKDFHVLIAYQEKIMPDSNVKRRPVSFEDVSIEDAFWAPRLAANRERGLTTVYDQLEKTGRLDVYRLNWSPGSLHPKPHVFWDSDIAKWVEGACYSFSTHPDPGLIAKVEDVIDRVLASQWEDGYINPYFTVIEPDGRWKNLRDKHELYCAGHLIEAAIAHHKATGKTRFLDAMERYAALISQVFGRGKGQIPGYPGHEEIELALIKLYRHTGKRDYLDQARYFIEERGCSPYFFDIEAQQRGEKPGEYWAKTHAYTQSHAPVRQQHEVVGHAVRAMYLYSAVSDLAFETADVDLVTTLKLLWDDLVSHKIYITGGIGSSSANEGFTTPYDLPNQTAYAETCASIGLIFWAHRMLQLDLDSQYGDVLERVLYNSMLSGVSLGGDQFFYTNPLSSDGRYHRQSSFHCFCCPPNINRFLPTLGSYIYSRRDEEIDIHLYVQSKAKIDLEGDEIIIEQETDYPWDGIVCIRLEMGQPHTLTLKLRQPGWCKGARLYLNGQSIKILENLDNGYITLHREWRPDDQLRLQLLMPVQRTYAHPEVNADIGRVSLMRGPLVYCLEAVDQPVSKVSLLRLRRDGGFDCEFEPDLLGGVISITGTAGLVSLSDWGDELYHEKPPALQDVPFKAVPYYAWDHRSPGEMQVWIPEV
jgi:DUF1680 family protein